MPGRSRSGCWAISARRPARSARDGRRRMTLRARRATTGSPGGSTGTGPRRGTRPRPGPRRARALAHARVDGHVLAERLAAAVDGEVVRRPEGVVVRCEVAARTIAARPRAARRRCPASRRRTRRWSASTRRRPGSRRPPGPWRSSSGSAGGRATGSGRSSSCCRTTATSRRSSTALASHIPPDGWLVTYNGRGFDWPLLVARYRMARRPAPAHAGHLDLLPIVRRLFRHRLGDARLRTAEAGLLGLHRHGDVDGWEIPGRYLGFLRGGPAEPLVDVVRHNDQDVRSLARLLGAPRDRLRRPRPRGRPHRPATWPGSPGRSPASGRLGEALGCLDAALAADPADPVALADAAGPGGSVAERRGTAAGRREEPWWSPRVPADFGGRRRGRGRLRAPAARHGAFATPWSSERIAVERAHLLRRLGRWDDGRRRMVGAGRRVRAGPRSSPRSSWPSSASTGCAIRRGALAAAPRGLALADRRRAARPAGAARSRRTSVPARRLRRRLASIG